MHGGKTCCARVLHHFHDDHNNKKPQELFLSFRARRNIIYRVYQYCACAHGRGARLLPMQPKQPLAHLRDRATESCCSLWQVHPSEAKKLLGDWSGTSTGDWASTKYKTGLLLGRVVLPCNSTVKRACLITVCTYF